MAPIPGTVIKEMYAIPVANINLGGNPLPLSQHKQNLEPVPKQSAFVMSNPRMAKAKPMVQWAMRAGFFGVPIAYGLEHFGPPERDLRFQGKPINLRFVGELWKEGQGNFDQQKAYDDTTKWMDRNPGRSFVLKMPTGGGKTPLVAKLLADAKRAGKKVLYIVPSKPLFAQAPDSVRKFFPDGVRFGSIKGKKLKVKDCDIVIAMAQSLAVHSDPSKKGAYKEEDFQDFGTVIYDECHTVPAMRQHKIFQLTSRIPLQIGITATLRRQDGMERLLEMHIGPVAYDAPESTAASRRTFVQPMIFRCGTTPYREKPVAGGGGKGWRRPADGADDGPAMCPDLAAMNKDFTKDPVRNAFILHKIDQLYKMGRSMVVFMDDVQHARDMSRIVAEKYWPEEKLPERTYKLDEKTGENKETTPPMFLEERVAHYAQSMSDEQREIVRKKRHRIVFATQKMLGKGVDFQWLNTIVLCNSHKDYETVSQTKGRFRFNGTQLPDGFDYLILQICDPHKPFPKQERERNKILVQSECQIMPPEVYVYPEDFADDVRNKLAPFWKDPTYFASWLQEAQAQRERAGGTKKKKTKKTGNEETKTKPKGKPANAGLARAVKAAEAERQALLMADPHAQKQSDLKALFATAKKVARAKKVKTDETDFLNDPPLPVPPPLPLAAPALASLPALL